MRPLGVQNWGLRGAVAPQCLALPGDVCAEVPGQDASSSVSAGKSHLGTRSVLWNSSLCDSQLTCDSAAPNLAISKDRLSLGCGVHSQRNHGSPAFCVGVSLSAMEQLQFPVQKDLAMAVQIAAPFLKHQRRCQSHQAEGRECQQKMARVSKGRQPCQLENLSRSSIPSKELSLEQFVLLTGKISLCI